MVTLTQFTCSKLYYKPCLKLIENVGQLGDMHTTKTKQCIQRTYLSYVHFNTCLFNGYRATNCSSSCLHDQ